MPPREDDDDVAPRGVAPSTRTLVQAGGFALAALATLAVFLTDNAQYLRVAVVAVAWAFVLATFAAGRRDTDRVAAAAREAELRWAYEAELDREIAARREYEIDLEHELRREAEDAMRYELDALRGDIAALSGLRDEVARVASLRDDVAALGALRQDLGQLTELRADMGRLRAEVIEQLSSEMLVERIVMRTQASRMPGAAVRLEGAPGRALEGSSWADDVPPRELTGGWPAIRLDEPRETSRFEEVRVERSGLRPPVPVDSRRQGDRDAARAGLRPWDAPLPTWDPPGTSAWSATPATGAWSATPATGAWSATPATSAWSAPAASDPGEWRSRQTADEPVGPPPTTMCPIAPASIASPPAPPMVTAPPPAPLDWLAARSLLDAPSEPRTTHRPAVPPPSVRVDDRHGYRMAVRDQAPSTAPGPAQERRLADILAENGVSPSSGGRRRHRYRNEGEPDDVLARVLGQS